METSKLKQILSDGNLNKEVHLYCNGFCKYCPATDKCANYLVLAEDLDWGKQQKQSFIIHGSVLEERFLYTMEHIIDFADKIGFDIDGIILKPENELNINDNQLTDTAQKCADKTVDFLSSAIDVYIETQEKVKAKLVKVITKNKSKRKVAELYISIEYIEFLSTVISGKLVALFSKEVGTKEEKDGCARMIIDTIMQVLCAWDIILEQIPNQRDQYMELLLDYYWVMASVSASFPDAGKFKRKDLDY